MTACTHRWPPVDHGGTRFLARPFAEDPADLDIDFAAMPRVDVVTRLLAQCLQRANGDAIDIEAALHWPVPERLQGLLAIARASRGATLRAVASCGHAGCAMQIEVELGVDAFAAAASTEIVWQSPEGSAIRLRLPTGNDLSAWRAPLREHGAAAEAWLARRLILSIDGRRCDDDAVLPDHWLAPLAAALQDADPLTALTIDVQCPGCERMQPVQVDLEPLLIAALRACQAELDQDIHQLATHYHWSEAAIVALPAWRRRRYVARLQAEFA
jgi:hypothetical protein